MPRSRPPSILLLVSLALALWRPSVADQGATVVQQVPCRLPAIEIERLSEYVAIRRLLKREAFPAWDIVLPPILLLGTTCQWAINCGPGAPAGFSDTGQSLTIEGLSSPHVFARRNVVHGPETLQLEYTLPAVAYTYGSQHQRTWMVMSTYECFKRDYGDSLGFYMGVLAHETFHPYQFRRPLLKSRMERFSKATFTRFHNSHPEFAAEVRAEMELLKSAILAKDHTVKKTKVAKALSLMAERRLKWSDGSTKMWLAEEALMQTVEGSAEYMNVRFRLGARRFPYNPALAAIDPSYTHHAEYAQYGIPDAISDAFSRPSYVQNEGVLELILLDQVDPTWAASIFDVEGFGEELLRRWVRGK